MKRYRGVFSGLPERVEQELGDFRRSLTDFGGTLTVEDRRHDRVKHGPLAGQAMLDVTVLVTVPPGVELGQRVGLARFRLLNER